MHCCKGSRSHISLPSRVSGQGTGNPQGLWLWRPVGFNYKTSARLGKQRLHSWSVQIKTAHTRPGGKGAVTPQETEPDRSVSVWGSPAEVCAGSGPPQAQGTSSSSPGRCAPVPLEITSSTTWEPGDSKTGSPQAKPLTGVTIICIK